MNKNQEPPTPNPELREALHDYPGGEETR